MVRILRSVPIALALSFMAALAGCLAPAHPDGAGHADDGHHDGSGATGEGNLPVTGAEDATVQIQGGAPDEFRFSPDAFTVQEGQRIAIGFTNVGELPHEFSINEIGFHLHLEPGQSASAAFLVPEEGTYTFGCYVPGHFESGMKGTMTVGG